MFGNLNTIEIEHLLTTGLLGRIGCHANDLTYIVPISYAYDGEYVYAHTHEGLKMSMMRTNPKVCFEVESMPNMANWQTVICWGEFEEVINPADRVYALEKLHDRNLPLLTSATTMLNPEWPFRPNDMKNIKGLIFRIQLTKKSGRYETYVSPSVMAW
jgi:nitroimidazol reductase NimA-like FMN-containing flavoprotein (pyridoxamine 5'-phosphate oxidase superfamily)